MTISCFIIDDEPLALGLLESYVSKTPFLKLIGKFSSAIAASVAMSPNPPDLMFLDIQMSDLNGMEFAKIVPANTKIIFTTAFEQYALSSYKVNALDYLLKPFSYADFLNAANKALKWYELQSANIKPTTSKKCIFVKEGYRLVQVELTKILYIESLKDYLKIFLEGENNPIIAHITMKAMEDMLDEEDFIRVHRSFIVRTDQIKMVERNRIVFGKTYIPVSDSYKDTFQTFLDKQLLQ